MSCETGTFDFNGRTVVYDDYGEGDRLVVYLHGLLLDSEMNRALAESLAEQGFRVVLLELLGHGRSDKPTHASHHRMDGYADQVVALLDHLGVDQCVLGGVSLGANVALFAGVKYPERLRGLIVEMPVLETAVPTAALLFVPLLYASHYGRFLDRPLGAVLSRIPRLPIGAANSFLHAAAVKSDERAAVLHGLLVGPIAPTHESRAAMRVPTLVVGHRFDPIHAFGDADNLAALLPDATLVRATSIIELRLFPARLTNILAQFTAERWDTGARVVTTTGDVPKPSLGSSQAELDLGHRSSDAEKRRIAESG